MRFLDNAIGSAMQWAEGQPPLELLVSLVAVAAVLYVVFLIAEGPSGS